MATVRIAGPDSTSQWRVVVVARAKGFRAGDVLMDGLATAGDAINWAKGKRHTVEPSEELAAQLLREHNVTRIIQRSRNPRAKKANPQLLTIGNPSSREMAQAIDAYRRFHGVEPRPEDVVRGGGHGILVALGELRRIDYKPRRGERRSPTWFHHFKPGCVLCATPDGRRLVILDREAKRLVNFDRGIVR